MAKAAEIAKTDKEWWRNFLVKDGSVWITFSSGDFAFSPNREYRLKPRYIDINGHQVPEPVREPLEIGAWFFMPSVDCIEMVSKVKWREDEYCDFYLRSGVVHTTEDAAIRHAVALLSFTQK
ncbi:hypothetical protein [Morganella morganii]|uniref:hypothetical protein n=1 Tax=Morganella morganii TaxID=582 RepID=UPI0013B3FD28|nr:hypothetical protein [Morganella morganii]